MKEKEAAINAAKLAGSYLKKHFKTDTSLSGKRGLAKEITTKYDKGADQIIIRELQKKFPKYGFLTEESGEIPGNEYKWIVDSLDGSSNFANSNPFFSVSIALVKNNEIILGVIYAPIIDELVVAEKGKGVKLNNKKISVSHNKQLSNSYIIVCEGGERNTKRISKIASRLYPKVKDLRKLGSAAIEGYFVACGRGEAYVSLSISPWDIAAAVLAVEEAGGKVSDFHGKPWKIKKEDIIMSNKKVHNQVLKSI